MPKVPVWVYYDSPDGASTADRVAVRLRAAGWLVEAVEPVAFYPVQTTVYYENRFEAAARYLRETFPGIGSAQLRPHALRQTNGIIVLLTRTYAG